MSRNSPETILTAAAPIQTQHPAPEAAPRARADMRALVDTVRRAASPAPRAENRPTAERSAAGAEVRLDESRRRPAASKRWPIVTTRALAGETRAATRAERFAGEPIDPVAEIALRLRAAAGNLVRATGPAGGDRFASLIARALAGLIDQSVRDLRIQIGTSAQSAAPASRRRLQDLALAMRPDPDRMLADVARSLTDSELLALLSVSCWARDGASLDSLRCRDLVFGGGNAMAREAALDMASNGPCDSARSRIETVVARHVRIAIGVAADDTTMLGLLDTALAPRGPDVPATETTDRLEERRLGRSLLAGDRPAAMALLAERCGVEPGIVGAASERRDSKGLVSLLWHAGYDPALAVPIQIVLGRSAPDEIANGTGEDGFPFRRAEMQWESEGLRSA